MDIPSYLLGKKAGGGSGGALEPIVVEELPQTGQSGKLYLVPRQTTETNNVFDEYIYVNNAWELIGTAKIDLSGKQDLITSTNKLDASLVDDSLSTNKFVTSTEKTTWNGKQDLLTAGDNITIQNNVISASGGGAKIVIFDIRATAQERIAKAQEIYNDQINGKIDQIYLNDNGAIYEMNYEPFDTGFMVICNYFDERASYNTTLYGIKLYKRTQTYAIYSNSDPNNFIFTKNLHSYVFYDNNTLPLGIKNTTAYTPTGDYNPATKKYVDDKPKTYTGYDATKTQVLKNINGTLTWVDET